MDIEIPKVGFDPRRLTALHAKLAAFVPSLQGVSFDGTRLYVHLSDAVSDAERETATQIAARQLVLYMTADKPQITANGTDTVTITCQDGRIAADAGVLVTCWLNGEEYTAPTTVAPENGRVQVTLATDTTGTYQIEIARVGTDQYETGVITLRAV